MSGGPANKQLRVLTLHEGVNGEAVLYRLEKGMCYIDIFLWSLIWLFTCGLKCRRFCVGCIFFQGQFYHRILLLVFAHVITVQVGLWTLFWGPLWLTKMCDCLSTTQKMDVLVPTGMSTGNFSGRTSRTQSLTHTITLLKLIWFWQDHSIIFSQLMAGKLCYLFFESVF